MKKIWSICFWCSACFAVFAAGAPEPLTLSYGPHERNTLDLWQAEGDTPHPLLIYIHGGGWLGGDKTQISGRVNIDYWLAKGVSVASIDYRYSSDAILPAPVNDAARAVQFLRFKAKDLNLNPNRVALQGGSAGGCSLLYILFHDDLADPKSSDPVLRESTRVQGAYGQFPQTSIDPVVLTEWIDSRAAAHPMIYKSVGASGYRQMMQDVDDYESLFKEFSPVNHLDAEDPPLFLTYPSNMTLPPATVAAAIHHGMFGVKLQERGRAVGYLKCELKIDGVSSPEHYKTPEQFLSDILLKGW